jgi:hypothetical protein
MWTSMISASGQALGSLVRKEIRRWGVVVMDLTTLFILSLHIGLGPRTVLPASCQASAMPSSSTGVDGGGSSSASVPARQVRLLAPPFFLFFLLLKLARIWSISLRSSEVNWLHSSGVRKAYLGLPSLSSSSSVTTRRIVGPV